MANIKRIPFAELFERCQQELIRDASSAEGKYKGRINDIYLYDIPSQIDWMHIVKESSITTVADYSTGTVDITTGTTSVAEGDETVSWTSANSNTLLFRVSGDNEVYRITYSSSTALTLDRNYVEDTVDEGSYTLYQDRYALASDFDHMILDSDQAVYYWSAGSKVYLKWRDPDLFEKKQTGTPSDPGYYTVKYPDGDPYIYIDPPDTDARTIHYSYIPSLVRMTEYTTGTITTLANAGTAVTGSSTDFDGFVTDTTAYDYYFRIDSDGTGASSVWYKISSADSDTGITLADAYAGTAISSGTSAFTISVISLLPSGLDMAIMYGAASVSAMDQGNRGQAENYGALYQKILDQYRSIEGKKKYGKQRIHTCYEKAGTRR